MPAIQKRNVSIVIPTWLRGDLLRKCLESIRKQSYSDFEIILISNGAGPWADELAKEFSSRIIHFPNNRGYAAAVNAGIRASDSAYVIVLNDDVELDPDWVRCTTQWMDAHPECSFCCGKIRQANGKLLDNVGDAISLGGLAWRLGSGRKDTGQYDTVRRIAAISGTAALFRRSAFDKAGIFDEDFVSYLEDVEWSIRAARCGLKGEYLPYAECVHHGSATLGKKSSAVFELSMRNQLRLLVMHYPWQWYFQWAHRIALAQLHWLLVADSGHLLGAYMKGVIGFIRDFRKTLEKRRPWLPEDRNRILQLIKESEIDFFQDVTADDRPLRGAFWKLYFFPIPNTRVGKHNA